MCVKCEGRPEEGVRAPGTGLPDGCKPPCGVGVESSGRAASAHYC